MIMVESMGIFGRPFFSAFGKLSFLIFKNKMNSTKKKIKNCIVEKVHHNKFNGNIYTIIIYIGITLNLHKIICTNMKRYIL